MPTNTTAKRYRVYIVDQSSDILNFEVTAACSGDSSGFLVVNEPEPDQTGVLARTGKLSLQVSDGYIDGNSYTSWSDNGQTEKNVFNSDLNPTRWAVGNKLRILIQSEFSSLDSPVFDYLRILKLPDPPYPGNPNIEIEIGDDLALLNWRTPDDDASGVTLGEATGKGAIVSNLLSAAGFNNGINADWAGTIPGFLSRSVPKAGGSWVEQAGKLAFSSGRILYQNGAQEIRAKAINLAPESPILTVTLGEGEVDFKPVRGSEKPCSIVRCTCVDSELVERTEEGESVSEERAPRAVVPELDPEGELVAGSSEEILIRQTFERWFWDDDYRTFTRETTVNECRGLSVPDQFYFDLGLSKPNSPYSLITSEIKVEQTFFGENATPEEGFQIRTETTIQRLNGAELQDYYKALYDRTGTSPASDYLELIPVETTNTYYRYLGTQTREIVSQTISRLGAVAGSADDWSNTEIDIPNGLDFIISGKTEQAWSEVNPNEWKLTDRASSAGQGSGSIAVLSALVRTKDSTTNSTSGQNDPPAAETRPPQYSQVEKERRGSVQFEPLAGQDYAPRERTYQVDYLASDAECENAAEILGTFLWGRHQGFQITVPYSEAWLNYQPLSRIDVIDSGTRITGLTSGVSFVFAADRAIVCVNCLKLGLVSQFDTTQIRKPYKIKRSLKTGQGQGLRVRILPYGNPPALHITAGQGQGTDIHLAMPPVSVTAGQGQGVIVGASGAIIRITAGQGQGIDIHRVIDPVSITAGQGQGLEVTANAPVGTNPLTTDYENRVVANGGTLSSGQKSAINTYFNALDAASLTSKIKEAYLLFGSLEICQTKLLYVSTGNATLSGFVLGDLASGGLKGDGSSRYIDSTYAPLDSGTGLDSSNFHLYLAGSEWDTSGLRIPSGLSSSPFFCNFFANGNPYTGYVGSGGADVSFGSFGSGEERMLFSANASNDLRGYLNGALVETETASRGSTTTSRNLFIFARNDGSAAFHVSARLKYGSVGTKLTDSEAAAYDAIVATLLSSLA